MTTPNLTRYARDPVAFFDRFIRRNELGQPFSLAPHQREILALAFQFDADGRLPWDTIIWSCIKKEGKTTVNAGVTGWWGFTQEPPNELLILANDLEQAQSRAFKTLSQLIQNNPQLARSATVQAGRIQYTNGTITTPLANDFGGNAGSNHGLTSWDELWAYNSEADRRLWEELVPVPTRRNSIRFITTYAGFENESSLLRELYLLGVGTDEHPDGKGERLHPTLPVYGNRAARIFCYWDHEPRMPWQTPEYLAARRRSMRLNAYLRLHENRWTSSESAFITGEAYDACVDAEHRPLLPTKKVPLYVGVDAAIKHDTAAIEGVTRDGDRIDLAVHRVWTPTPDQPLDLESTIERFLRELHEQYDVRAILCDPWQLQRSIQTLRAAGLPIAEFPQTVPNQTRAGQLLFDLFTGRNLRLFENETLRQHVLNCVAVESTRGWRLAKERSSRKIDSAVALSMAVVAAVEEGGRPQFDISAGRTPSEWNDEERERIVDKAIVGAQEVDAIVLYGLRSGGGFWFR